MQLINSNHIFPKGKEYVFCCARSALTNSFLTAELTPAYRGQVVLVLIGKFVN